METILHICAEPRRRSTPSSMLQTLPSCLSRSQSWASCGGHGIDDERDCQYPWACASWPIQGSAVEKVQRVVSGCTNSMWRGVLWLRCTYSDMDDAVRLVTWELLSSLLCDLQLLGWGHHLKAVRQRTRHRREKIQRFTPTYTQHTTAVHEMASTYIP